VTAKAKEAANSMQNFQTTAENDRLRLKGKILALPKIAHILVHEAGDGAGRP
jgi:hypothetical protein